LENLKFCVSTTHKKLRTSDILTGQVDVNIKPSIISVSQDTDIYTIKTDIYSIVQPDVVLIFQP
jgi:hypothetical protein